eukprot:5942825-Prorocentrum_lima.AAC.1
MPSPALDPEMERTPDTTRTQTAQPNPGRRPAFVVAANVASATGTAELLTGVDAEQARTLA